MTSMTAVYRLQQGVRALFAFSQPVDWALAERYLSPKLLALFRQMDRGEQLHSLGVLRVVLAQGDTPTDLGVATLLHDVGKSRYPISVWQKTLVVIVRALMPGATMRWSKGSPLNLWERPFVVYEQHPLWSAELLGAAGASEAVCWLVAHHADHIETAPTPTPLEWLKRLQQADDQN
jgi:hypothetical protein